MFKRILLTISILCLVILPALPVGAQTGIEVTSSSANVQFPTAIVFNITAQSNSPITDIRLHYSVEHLGFANVFSEAFLTISPSTKITTQWKWDMVQSGGLPPGTVVHYSWVITDASGSSLTTTSTSFQFDDSRFSWKSLTKDRVTIFWYSGSQSFADELMSSAQNALVTLKQSTGASPTEDVRLYIYANSSDLQGSMIFPQEWTGGVTFTEYGSIAIGISTSNLAWGKRAIAHELAHLITHQITLNPYNDIPVWLDEGLAMYNEGPIESQFSSPLNNAISKHTLLSLMTLSSPFSSYADVSYLSYAESWSAVDYLIRTYGKDKIFQLLNAFHKGNTYDGALQQVYGLDTRTLNGQWQQSLYGAKASAGQPFELAGVIAGSTTH